MKKVREGGRKFCKILGDECKVLRIEGKFHGE